MEEVAEKPAENEAEKPESSSQETPETRKKETKKILILIGALIAIFIIIFAGIYIARMRSTEKIVTIDDLHQKNIEGEESEVNYVYNGFSFVYINGMWYTQVELGDALLDLPLHYSPREVEDVQINGTINKSFMRKEIYITFNPTEDNQKYVALAASELTLSMAKGMGITPVAACDRNESDDELKQIEIDKACTNRSIITCESGEAAVYLLQQEPMQVEMKGNCVLVQGVGLNLTKAVDRLLYEWYGVMDFTE
jgi:hypothetical protein